MGGGDWRNRFCSFYERGLLWMERIWTETRYFWRQPTHCRHWHGRVQNKHQSKSVWPIWTAWGLRAPEPCLLDLSTLQVWEASLTRDPTLCIQRWGIFCWSYLHQKTLPYIFKQLDGGRFPTDSSYGSIQLSHFSQQVLYNCWKKGDSSSLLCTDLLLHNKGGSIRLEILLYHH